MTQEHLRRVRQICAAMPECTEKLSHGEPTFFVRKKVFVMFANNHHNDGHIAVWIPALPGDQAMLIKNPRRSFSGRPTWVCVAGSVLSSVLLAMRTSPFIFAAPGGWSRQKA
jgi:hypothetical protein